MARHSFPVAVLACCLLLLSAACSTTVAIPDAASQPPLDAAVLVTGAFALPAGGQSDDVPATFGAEVPGDLQPLVDALQAAGVFRRIALDPDAAARGAVPPWDAASPDRDRFLQQARDAGHDWLLVVEGLRDGPIE